MSEVKTTRVSFRSLLLLELVQDPSHVQIEGGDRGEVALEGLPVPHVVAQPAARREGALGRFRPGMEILLGARFEGAIVVGVDDVLRMAGPGGVRGGVVNAYVEGVLVGRVRIDIGQRIVGNDVRHVAGCGHGRAVADHVVVVVVTGAAGVGEPVGEPMLRQRAGAQVPFPGQGAVPAVLGQHIRVTDLVRQEGARIGSQSPRALDEIVHAVLGGNPAGQQRGPAGRADRDGDEEVLEPHPGGGDTVEVRRPDLRIAVAAGGPDGLVVGEYENDVGAVRACHVVSFVSLLLPLTNSHRGTTVRWRCRSRRPQHTTKRAYKESIADGSATAPPAPKFAGYWSWRPRSGNPRTSCA